LEVAPGPVDSPGRITSAAGKEKGNWPAIYNDPAPGRGGDPVSTPARILITEDNPQGAELLEAFLAETPHDTKVAANGEEALRLIADWRPDVVLLDIMMPELEGSEVAAALKQDPVTREVPVIFLTALVSQQDAPTGTCSSGGHTFLPKNIRVDRLIHCIEDKISHQHAGAVR
jgi:two-component system, OmpR family, alkaline phosphatase synthesis response regulator PhoP